MLYLAWRGLQMCSRYYQHPSVTIINVCFYLPLGAVVVICSKANRSVTIILKKKSLAHISDITITQFQDMTQHMQIINIVIHMPYQPHGRKCQIENLVPRNWRNVKIHDLISGIKSKDTYGYAPDYTKPLTCIGCHIGFISIRSDRVWLNILLGNKNPSYRHWYRLSMLIGSKTTGYLLFWRLC